MEAELEKFRRRKKLDKYKAEVTSKVKNLWSSMENSITEALLPEPTRQEPNNEDDEFENDGEDGDERCSSSSSIESVDLGYPFLTYVKLALKVVLWFVLFMGFVSLGFGAIYFIVSSLIIIWRNTRKSPRKPGEPSAYSVFNPNCEAIHGTLKPEQLEKQLLFMS